MGFNFQGIACSKKYASEQDMARSIGLGTLEKTGVSYFETATSRMDDGDIFITAVANGTIVTLGSGFDIQDINLADASTGGSAISFMIGETAMVFALVYWRNGQPMRTILHAEGECIMEEGIPLSIEETETDMTEMIFSLIGDVTGKGFYSIEPDIPSVQCRML